ncbi:MAG TPA: hypothetical protein PLX59_04170, partial [Candidatus Cloacimonadota bacterium]|nr:hypothetical protein [Candidatus Cloacimonadota bacterium]
MSAFRSLSNLDEFIDNILSEPRFRDSIVATKSEEEREPEWAALPTWLPEQLLKLLQAGRIDR